MSLSIKNSIDQAATVIGETWPLYTFVASNPLSGYENSSFIDAVNAAQKNFSAQAFPKAKLYRQAWENKAIDKKVLMSTLADNGFSGTPESYLNELESYQTSQIINENHVVDRIMAKWLSSFMDEGLAEWDMPYKSEGFFTAWRLLVIYDAETGTTALKDIPKTSIETLQQALTGYHKSDYTKIFTHHLASLPGWTGYINHRTASASDWQNEFPISFMDYLAARLWTANKLGFAIFPETTQETGLSDMIKMQHIWLKAWEQTWQEQLVETLKKESITSSGALTSVPDAQMVFCIDTRSELIRRHVEATGNYETFGYAGFFGIAMDYESLKDGIIRKACPPIVGSAYKVTETSQDGASEQLEAYKKKITVSTFTDYFLKRMKNMLPSAFGYVEGSGLFYGILLTARTLFPKSVYKANNSKASMMENACQPIIKKSVEDGDSSGIPLNEKVAIVKSAFDLMGWKEFAPLVVFAGHGSHSANNPFSSSLDCGACAASPGRHNARMLAKLANLSEVRKVLKETHNVMIPEDTIFIGAEHNTTTDEIVLFDVEVPSSHKHLVKTLKMNLSKAQKTATEDRLGSKGNSVASAHKKATNWGETRPEWGLAKNAGFIVGPRILTKNTNLDSRCFLHSYDWQSDVEGKSLEGIMQGPMVVTQWINNHYYFSTVDNNTYGGGSKITHNITGKFGVVQGNGGDLKMGLPLQSLFDSDEAMYHQPLRLSVMIQSPVDRVTDILSRNSNLQNLLDNQWIYLMVMDPTQDNQILKYTNKLNWKRFYTIEPEAVLVK